MTYCGISCQTLDWPKHREQCWYWRLRRWLQRLLNRSSLLECHVRVIVAYTIAPPFRRKLKRAQTEFARAPQRISIPRSAEAGEAL